MKIRFSNNLKADFFTILKQRVDNYFVENKISSNGNALMFFKSVFFLGIFFITYSLIISEYFAPWIMLLLCINLGLFTAFIGFNVGHDAVHGSYSSSPVLNKIMGYTFEMLGASSYLWSIMHNMIHHTYTNIPDHDDDLEPVFLIRLNPTKKLYKVHKYQHWYATILYGLTSFSWVFMKDYKKIFQKEIGGISKQHPLKEIIILFAAKLLYYVVFLVIPMLALSIAWWQVLLGFFVMHVAQGITLAIVFQLAHVVEHTHFPVPDEKGKIENNWAIHQVNTTANFATKSFLATWCFGGLNYQIEHHLFPRICHIHYPQISEIVKSTCKEYNLTYIENKTMLQAMASHYRLLKKLGREENFQFA